MSDSGSDRAQSPADLSSTDSDISPISPASDFPLSEERTWEPDYTSPEEDEEPQFRGMGNQPTVQRDPTPPVHPVPPPPPVAVPLDPPVTPAQYVDTRQRRGGASRPVAAAETLVIPAPRVGTPPLPVPGDGQ